MKKQIFTQEIQRDETDILEHGAYNYSHNVRFSHHLHRQIELHYVISGEVTVLVNGATYNAKKGELLIIKSYDSHYCDGCKRNRLMSPILSDAMSYVMTQKNIKSQVISDESGELLHIIQLAKSFSTATARLKELYFSMLTQAILTLCTDQLIYSRTEIVNPVLAYITANITTPLSLDRVARECCTNRCEVSRSINNITGHNFNSYINILRVNRFVERYTSGDMASIVSIAEECGFESMRTFYRAFGNIYGCSPQEYLDRTKLNI